ncbi:Cell division protein DedD [Halomonadaceae bacterium LMG 33818]|uniref:SPOR domain-containing protein n=1 Tax=Cernens ardua TaxID=3402176 RepID=UPI003EDC64E9
MKYGTREKIIGAVILIALAIIIVPMFFGSHKKGGQAPQMTINQQPINVPDQNTQGAQSGQQGAEGNGSQPTENSGSNGNSSNGSGVNANGTNDGSVSNPNNGSSDSTSVSQYNQLLPGSKGPQPINQSAGDSQGNASQSGSYNQYSGQSNSAPQQTVTQAPQPAPVIQHHSNPAPVHHQAPVQTAPRPAPQHSSNTSRATTSTPSGNHTPAPAHKAPQPAHTSSASSQDPIMAAADRYGHSSSSAHASAPTHASGSAQWSVQVGSFQDRDNAVRLTARLRAMGFSAYQISRGANKVVMVGPFSSSAAGESARQQLQQKANTNGFVVRGTSE